jgi:hypothetical protein
MIDNKLSKIGEFRSKENDMNKHKIRKWKMNVSPPFLRRGGSAHGFVLCHYFVGVVRAKSEWSVFTTSPKSM